MQDPFPLPGEAAQRARAVQRLRAAVETALRGGQQACDRAPHIRSLARPLLERLKHIGRELDRMEELQTGYEAEESSPFWIELLNEIEAQTPRGKSPPPENISR